MKPLRKLSLLWLLLLLPASALAWGDKQPIQNYEHIAVARVDGKPLTVEQVKTAIISGATHKGWVVSEQGPGRLRATLNLRKHQAVIDIPYDAGGYGIQYVSSINLDVGKNDEGVEVIHPNYNRWLKNLIQSVNGELQR